MTTNPIHISPFLSVLFGFSFATTSPIVLVPSPVELHKRNQSESSTPTTSGSSSSTSSSSTSTPSSSLLRGSNGCVLCPTTPTCPSCPSGQVCNLSAQTCDSCPEVSCIDNSSTYINNNGSTTSTSTPTNTATSAATSSITSNNLLAPLIAGITGGVVLLCISAFLVFYCRRKRKAQHKLGSPSPEMEKETAVKQHTTNNNTQEAGSELQTIPGHRRDTYQQNTSRKKESFQSHHLQHSGELSFAQLARRASTPKTVPPRPPRPSKQNQFNRSYSNVADRGSSIYSQNLQHHPSWAVSRASTNEANSGPLSLEEQLNYIKQQQIILEQEELEEQARAQQNHPDTRRESHSHFYPLQNLQSKVSEEPIYHHHLHHTHQPSHQPPPTQRFDESHGSKQNRLTTSSLNLSAMLAEEALTLSRTGNLSPSMTNILQNIPSTRSSRSDRHTPYDEYLLYVQNMASDRKPSPSSSLQHLGQDSASSEASSSHRSANSGSSQVIPIAYIPGVTSNFSQTTPDHSPSKSNFASSTTPTPTTPSTTYSSQDHFSPRVPMASQGSTNRTSTYSRDSWRQSTNFTTAIRAPRMSRPPPEKISEDGTGLQRNQANYQSSSSSSAVVSPFSRISYPSTLEPTTLGRANILTSTSSAIVDRHNSRYISSEALDLDRMPIELTGPATVDDTNISLSSYGSDLSSSSDVENPDSPGYDKMLYNEIETFLDRSTTVRESHHEATEDTSRLQPFEYPVVYESSEDISYIKK